MGDLSRLIDRSTWSWVLLSSTLVFGLMGCGAQPTSLMDASPVSASGGASLVTDDEMPANEYCDAVANWDAAWVAFEDEVFRLINERRNAGADCGSSGRFGATPMITSVAELRCAARRHSLDMASRSFFDHTNPDGDGPRERMESAGYDGHAWGENIAFGQTSPASVVDGWMSSPGHCANIMSPTFTETGIGFYEGNFWTQVFGAR